MDFRVVYGTGTRSFSSSRRLPSSSETLAIWRHVVLSPLGIGQPILTTLEQGNGGGEGRPLSTLTTTKTERHLPPAVRALLRRQ